MVVGQLVLHFEKNILFDSPLVCQNVLLCDLCWEFSLDFVSDKRDYLWNFFSLIVLFIAIVTVKQLVPYFSGKKKNLFHVALKKKRGKYNLNANFADTVVEYNFQRRSSLAFSLSSLTAVGMKFSYYPNILWETL